MDSLFDVWKTKIPKYSDNYTFLFNSLSQKFGAEGEKKVNLGKNFSSHYELYMYAFFLGLYSETKIPIGKDEKRKDFSHHIQSWGSKGNKLGRKDFTRLQEYIFMALIAKTDIDLLALDQGKISKEDVVKSLIKVMEEYTNGGLTIIVEKTEESINPFIHNDSFLRLMINLK